MFRLPELGEIDDTAQIMSQPYWVRPCKIGHAEISASTSLGEIFATNQLILLHEGLDNLHMLEEHGELERIPVHLLFPH